MEVVIRKYGNLLDVSADGKSALQPALKTLLEPELSYVYKQYLRGFEARAISGKPVAIQTHNRKLHTYDNLGRLVCGAGFLDKLQHVLSTAGVKPIVKICDVIPNPPNAYDKRWDIVKKHFKFRDRQEEFIHSLVDHHCAAAEAPPGFGKSTLIAAICLLLPNARIDVTTKRCDVVGQLQRDLTKYVPNVGQVGGGKFDQQRVTVYTADSLHKSDGLSHVLIGDEAHELMADSYVRELARYRHSCMYAISASIQGRADGTDARMESIFGPVRFKLSYQQAVELGSILQIKVDWVDVIMPTNPIADKSDPTAKLRWGVWRNDHRNQLIASKAREFDRNEQTLILVQTVEHAVYLKQHLPEYTLVFSERDATDDDVERYVRMGMVSPYDVNISTKRRQQLRYEFEKGELKKVIATHVWDTGVDFVQLSVLIRADALASTIKDIQAPGRVCRRSDATSKSHGLVIDFMDKFDDGLYRKSLKRKKNYREKGWLQHI